MNLCWGFFLFWLDGGCVVAWGSGPTFSSIWANMLFTWAAFYSIRCCRSLFVLSWPVRLAPAFASLLARFWLDGFSRLGRLLVLLEMREPVEMSECRLRRKGSASSGCLAAWRVWN